MNEHNTVEKMKRMRLAAMADLYHRSLKEHLYQDYSLDDFLSLLIDTEWEHRQSRSIDNLIQRAGFKIAASAADIDYQTSRNLDKWIFRTKVHHDSAPICTAYSGAKYTRVVEKAV